MGKKNKKLSRSKKEEEQGKRVIRTLIIGSVVIAILFIVCFSIFS